jgi:WD40 repeat protein
MTYVGSGIAVVIRAKIRSIPHDGPHIVRTIPGLGDAIRGLSFHSGTGRLAGAAGPLTGMLHIWDAATGQALRSIPVARLYTVAFSPDGRRLATNAASGRILIWDALTGRELQSLAGHPGFVYCVAFSPDGRYLASASEDHLVKIWDVASGNAALTLQGHGGEVFGVAFSADGRRLASCSDDHTIRIWDAADGHLLLTLSGHQTLVVRAVFSPDGTHLASASGDGTVRVWDAVTGQETLQLNAGYGALPNDVAYSPDGKILAAAWNANRRDRPPGIVKVWDATSGEEIRSFEGHASPALSLVFLADGKQLASGSMDGEVKIWDVTFLAP